MKIFFILITFFTSFVFANTGDIACQFQYDSPGNPEKFTRNFSLNSEESFLIGQMTVRIATSTPKDKSLTNKFTVMNFGIWDDSGSVNVNQAEFYSNNVLVNSSNTVHFELKVRNPAVPAEKEAYYANCIRK